MSLETYGRYQLLKKLATGGMAQIFLARQVGPEGFEKMLVVKRILPHLAENAEFITMFLDEARIAARLNHPNIVQIFDLGAQDDSFFIAMEYIHGDDVRRLWRYADKKAKPLPVPLICRIIIEACAGLDYAHKKIDAQGRPLNIVHRDVSPQNILVSFEGAVKVVDFGIAKAADQATVTKSGVLKGKYSYMSPEQAAGQQIDRRSDIFALGVILHELLTRTRLFKRSNDIQTLSAVADCIVPPPSGANSQVTPELDAIVLKALARKREDRYSEASELAAALEAWLLQNQIPSSVALLSSYLRDLYSDRLKREAEEGRLLIETVEPSRDEHAIERATPSAELPPRKPPVARGSAPKLTQSMSAADPSLDPTTFERPAASDERPGPPVTSAEPTLAPGVPSLPETRAAPSPAAPAAPPRSISRRTAEPIARPIPEAGSDHPTEASKPKSNTWAVVLVGILVLLSLAGVGAWAIQGTRSSGFSLDTDPQGVVVSGRGVVLCRTPCVVQDLEPGEVTLELKAPGYKTLKRPITLQGGTQLSIGLIRLERESGRGGKPDEATMLLLDSDPQGAEVVLNGQVIGTTPVTHESPPGEVLELGVSLSGYVPASDRITVSTAKQEPHLYRLSALPTAAPTVKAVKDARRPPAGRGTVRFVVNPWAQVECPSAHFKDTTPFPNQQFPVGEHNCTFTNPELHQTQSRLVRVEPNATVKVQVTFQQ